MEAIDGLDRAALDRARLSRDPRFDGRFFIAVTSTGVYCRPVCPVRSPKKCNVRYYPTAAAAAEAGFRPCLRCRPEAAPGTPAWLGTSAVVRRALRLIQDGALDESSVAALAARLGIGPRHLHRLFLQHVGASPITVAQTRRLHFAKRLLDETELPITEIALAAGFGSVRRFNDTFHRTYGRAPRELRKQGRRAATGDLGDEVVLRLAFRPPYDWAQVRDFLATRAIAGVERVDEHGYARTLASDGGHTLVRVQALPQENALQLRVRGAVPADLFHISACARRTFDLAADPARILSAFVTDPVMGPLARRRPGLRIPGAWDPFECAVRAILGQQVSVAAAGTLASRVVARAGRLVATGVPGLTHLFPSPAELAGADLGGIGLTGARVTTLKSLAAAAADGKVDFRAAADEVVTSLLPLPGVGEWTAQYVALRALGEPDAFPAADLVLRRMAADGSPLTARELEARAETWRPWRGYAAVHLWRAAADRRRSGGTEQVRKRPVAARTRRLDSREPARHL
jgi:AraC family transcriptional regulator, regulatory protein of adaptative response / DNA-3-methyladenine glycosylase II